MDSDCSKLELEDCTSDYIANGTSGYITEIKYGMRFIPRQNIIDTKKKLNGKTYDKIMKTHWASEIKIVTILTHEKDENGNQKKKTIVTGFGAVSENNIQLGYCKTIDSIQGMEFKIGVFVIPKICFSYDEEFYCVNRLLVALSRAKEKLYIVSSANSEVNKGCLIQKGDSEWVKKIIANKQDHYTPLQVIQYMATNKAKEKRTIISELLKISYDKIKKRGLECEEEFLSNKKQKIQ